MKRIAFTLSIFIVMSVACNVSGTVTPPAPDLPVNTQLPANTEVPVVNTEVPGMGSTRVSETDGMTLVFVPGGDFTMGSDSSSYANEKPVHTVFLDSYWIDQTEVTNAMFETFVDQTGNTRWDRVPAWRISPSTRWCMFPGTMPRRIVNGRNAACRPKPNGRKPRVAQTAGFSHGATTLTGHA